MEVEHLDFDALNELKQIMGDDFTLLVDTFISDSIARIEAIKEAVNASEPEAIRNTAHSFKGSASNMGAPRLTELCRQLEDLGHSGQTEGSAQLMNQIAEEYEQVSQALSSF